MSKKKEESKVSEFEKYLTIENPIWFNSINYDAEIIVWHYKEKYAPGLTDHERADLEKIAEKFLKSIQD